MGGGWLTPRPGGFTPGKGTRWPLYGRLGGPWDKKNLPLSEIRSPDRTARREFLYWLPYPGRSLYGALFCKENGKCFFVVSWFDTIERRTSNNYVLLNCLVWSNSPAFSGHHIAVWLRDFVAEFCHPWRIFPVFCVENCNSRIALHISGLFRDT